MKLRGLIGAGLVLGLAGCASEIQVEGVVRDAETGNPIPGAVVHVGEEGQPVDESGRFEVEKIDAWSGQSLPVYVTAPGYKAVKYIRPVWDEERFVLELRKSPEPDTGREALSVGEEVPTIRTGPDGEVLDTPRTDGVPPADEPIVTEPSDEPRPRVDRADRPGDEVERDPTDHDVGDPKDLTPLEGDDPR